MASPTKYKETQVAAEFLGNSYLSQNGLVAELTWFLSQIDGELFRARASGDACNAVLYGLRDAIDIRLGEGKWPDEWPL